MTIAINIRTATADDAQTIYNFIKGLAEYEKLTHMLDLSPEKIKAQFLSEKPAAEVLIAEVTDDQQQKHAAGYALFFQNFSTFLYQPGLYLEDLYIVPEWRHHGIGKAMLSHLAGIAVERNYCRFEWSVLDWNKTAISFYEASGAQVLQDWRICRVTGDALKQLAQKHGKH